MLRGGFSAFPPAFHKKPAPGLDKLEKIVHKKKINDEWQEANYYRWDGAHVEHLIEIGMKCVAEYPEIQIPEDTYKNRFKKNALKQGM